MWWLAAAWAVEEPVDDEVIVIPPVEAPPSALDEPVALSGEAMVDWAGLTRMWRARWFVKPLLTYTQLERGDDLRRAGRVGVAGGRQWFAVAESPIQGGAMVEARISAPFGQARGYAGHLTAQAGPWLGPVGLWVGPTLRADRADWQGDLLAPAAFLGGRATLAVDVGRVSAWASVEPGWRLAGDRPSADPSLAALPLVGDEWIGSAGVELQAGWLRTSLFASQHETHLGGVFELGLGFAIRPGA